MATCSRTEDLSFNFSSGEPPTPTRTPTSPNFFLNSFETPKPDTKFNDPLSPWTPSFSLGPAFKTPTQASFQPVPSKAGLAPNGDVQVKGASAAPSTKLTTPTLPSRPPSDFQKPEAVNEETSADLMQTPPPTGTSIVKRRAQGSQIARSLKDPRTTMEQGLSIPTSSAQVEESPSIHFPNLQFSPDGLGFSMSGAATAPVYPQHRLFWDPEQDVNVMNLDIPMDDTFAGLGVQRQLDPFVSEHDTVNNLVKAKQPIVPSSAVSSTPRGKLINPSILFSSPSRPKTSGQKIQDDALKPYAHQLQDAEIERELRSRRSKRKRGADVESPAVQAATLALREAEEEGSQASSDSNTSLPLGQLRPRSSRHSRSSQNKRASVTLSIDASGRASTQTTFQDGMDLDVDTDSSSSDSSPSPLCNEIVFSQPSSFAYPIDRKKKIKSSSHSHKSSYGSSLYTPSEKAGSDKVGRNQVHFREPQSFISGQLNGSESEAETIMDSDEDKGNAQAELKKVLLQRSTKKPSRRGQRQTRAARVPPPSSLSYSQSSLTLSHLPYSEANQDISPTTVTDPDLATPTTGPQSARSDGSTRCVCSDSEAKGLMVQW